MTLSHSDSAVATATGDIVTGEYGFKLKVTDGEGQTGTETLTVNVKESRYRDSNHTQERDVAPW